MLEVIICEDDKYQRERLQDCVERYIMIEDLDMKISLSTESPDEVIDHVKKSNAVGLYFFDVDLQANYNGITLAAEIRKYDSAGFVVFITTHPELTYLTFIHKVAALDYIVKGDFDNMKDKVRECIKVAYNRYTNKPEEKKIFQVTTGGRDVFVDYDEILFFETDPIDRKVILYTTKRRLKFSGTLKEIVKLDKCLHRCHNSFVVNKKNIDEIDKENSIIRMINGEVCEASRRGLKSLLE